MTTFEDTIQRTRHHLMTGQQDKLNVLQTTVDDTTDTIQFTYEIKVRAGSTINIELEEMHVVEVGSTLPGSSIIVIRGMNGSIPAQHDAGCLIRCDPQFSDYRIGVCVNEELSDLPSEGLFQIDTATFDYVSSRRGYDLAAPNMIDVYRVSYNTPGPAHDWPTIPAEFWRLDRNADTSEFPSGNQLLIQAGGYPGHQIRVSYKKGYTALANLTDDVEVVSGLHAGGHTILPLGAAINLLGGREVKRTFLNRQPEPRRQQEVPPGSANQAMLPLIKRYEHRIRMEKRRLRRIYPGAY